MSSPVAGISSRFRSYSMVIATAALLLCLLALPQHAAAQIATTGKITGVVKDSSGAPVPNAAITAKSSALFAPRTTTSEADGSYLLDLLPLGTYEVTVSASGFKIYAQTGIVLTAGFTATINPGLTVGAVNEIVRVESEPAVDVQSVQTSTTFNEALLQDIPSGRDPWSTVAQMPGAIAGTFDVAGNNSYQQSVMQIHGSTPGEQIYSYNGLNLNWPGSVGGFTQFYTNHDSFEEFQVVSDGAPASVPIGGVYMNMVTKSGSNQVHGAASIYYLTAALQADVKFPTFGGAPQKSGTPFDMTRDTTVSLGGPLLKDRWWLFGSYRRYDLRQRNLASLNQAGNPNIDVNHQTNTDLRSDYQINAKNKFSFVWLYNEQNRFFRPDGTRPFFSQETTWRQIEPAYVLEGLWTSQITNNLLLDARVGWNKLTFPLGYQPGVGNSINIQDNDAQTETGAPIYSFVNPAWVLRYSVSASWYKGNLHGSHNFKFGFEAGKAYNAYSYRVNQGINEILNFAGVGPQFGQIVAYNAPTKQKNYFGDASFYVQDTWRFTSRLTLDLGGRYDNFHTYYPKQTTDPGAIFPQLFLPGSFAASGNLVNWNTFSPRLGVAYDLTGKGRSVLRFSYSRFYKIEGTGLAESANPVGLASLTFNWNDVNKDGIPQQSEWLDVSQATSAAGGQSTNINRKMSRPYADQVSAGYQTQLWRDLSVSATYYYRTKKNAIGRINTAVSPSDYVEVTRDASGAPFINGLTGQPITLFSFAPADNRTLGFNYLVTNVPQLDDNAYHGLEFTAVKRLSNKWQLLSGFTIQRQKGAFGRGFADEATGDDFNDPNLDINRKNNYLNSDATYIFKLDSSYEFPWKIGTSVNFQHYTGFPIQTTQSFSVPQANANGNPVPETVILQPAGPLRLPSVNLLNLRVTRDFVISDRVHVIPAMDFFNVTNAQTVTGKVGSIGSGYLFPFATINPFVTRFGLRVTF